MSIQSVDDIYEHHIGLNSEEKLYVGIEWERSGVYRDTLEPVQYLGENGYLAVYKKLIEEVGWEVLEEKDGNIYELKRGETKITTEADGRPELSGSPQESLHDLAREMRLHNNEILEMGNIFNIAWLPVSWQPFHGDDVIQFVPKKRYDFFKKIGIESNLKRNNGLTANLSVTNEENMIRKLQTMFRITPIVSAMFASGTFSEGKFSGLLDMRRHSLQSRPERFCEPENILDSSFGLRDWIDHYLKLPLTFIVIDGVETFVQKSITFAEWMEQGYEGRFPTIADFDQHVKSTWSDLRLRPGYIECRIAGSVPSRLTMSLPALIKGLIFDSQSWEHVAELTEHWTYEDVVEADKRLLKEGLQTEVHGHTLLTYAQELITLANEKLHGFDRTNAAEDDESLFLAPLKEQIFIKEKSPAEELLELYEGKWDGSLKHIVPWCEEESTAGA